MEIQLIESRELIVWQPPSPFTETERIIMEEAVRRGDFHRWQQTIYSSVIRQLGIPHRLLVLGNPTYTSTWADAALARRRRAIGT